MKKEKLIDDRNRKLHDRVRAHYKGRMLISENEINIL